VSEELLVSEAWTLRGELVLSCSCTVFCPCVISLGKHPPTEDRCLAWAAVRIDDGRYGAVDLTGVKAGFMLEIPGVMARGDWTVALFVDENASVYGVKALTQIFTGRAGGSTQLLKILVGSFLGVRQLPISYELRGETRVIRIEKVVDGAVTPIPGKEKGRNVVIRNSEYWVAPDITVARADKSRFRAFGRNWNFAGHSAEICQIDWSSE
jgi:hypothetical protein